jgi:LytS/YehU family sensor histidine kinase
MMAGQYLVVAAGVLGHAIRENFRAITLRNELENQRLEFQSKLMESELRFMKTQFHPHFLFNTLNNLYSLSLKKSDEAPGMILRLSKLLDYSLHGANSEQVSLSEEIQFIQNYIDIAQMRFGEKLTFHFDKEIDDTEFKMPPLLLMPFVENAVKHGISPESLQSWIRIKIHQLGKKLTFTIENSTFDSVIDFSTISGKTGLGLEQVRNRLNIILPESHNLIINKEEQHFSVTLIING